MRYVGDVSVKLREKAGFVLVQAALCGELSSLCRENELESESEGVTLRPGAGLACSEEGGAGSRATGVGTAELCRSCSEGSVDRGGKCRL